MRRWTFTIDGVPRTKERPRLGQSGRGGSGGQHHHTATTTVDYERAVGGAAMEARLLIGDGQCDIIIEVWLMPSIVSEGEARPRSRQRKDPDNVAKVVMDGMLKAGKGALADDGFDHIRNLHVARGGYSRQQKIVVTVIEVTHDAGSDPDLIQPFFGAAPPELAAVLADAARAAGWRPSIGGGWQR